MPVGSCVENRAAQVMMMGSKRLGMWVLAEPARALDLNTPLWGHGARPTSRKPPVVGPHLKKRRRERMWPRSTRNTPQICSRVHTRCGSSQRGACRRPWLSGKHRWASALEGELVEQAR